MGITIRPLILLIDDDVGFCRDLCTLLASKYTVEFSCELRAAGSFLVRRPPQVVLLNSRIDGDELAGLKFLRRITPQLAGRPPVIMFLPESDTKIAAKAMKAGVAHTIGKPPNLDLLAYQIEDVLGNGKLKRRAAALESDLGSVRDGFIAKDPMTIQLLDRVDAVAPTDATVLITGDSGTGKEMIAKRIHARSKRCDGPLVAFNFAAVPEGLIESELFGHIKGSFAGADRDRAGKFESARGGTLFLDEIGESPELYQVKVLRVLEEFEYYRVGSDSPVQADVRIIAATNKQCNSDPENYGMRRDLYFRLNEFRVHVPPLSHRRDDIEPLAYHFLGLANRKLGRRISGFTSDCLDELIAKPWPGNVRELEHLVGAMVTSCPSDRIDSTEIYLHEDPVDPTLTLKAARKEWDVSNHRRYLTQLLRLTGGNVRESAPRAGVSRQYMHDLLNRYGVDPDPFRRRKKGKG